MPHKPVTHISLLDVIHGAAALAGIGVAIVLSGGLQAWSIW